MPLDLSNTLFIGISATALFDMSASDKSFRERIRAILIQLPRILEKVLFRMNLDLKRCALLECRR